MSSVSTSLALACKTLVWLNFHARRQDGVIACKKVHLHCCKVKLFWTKLAEIGSKDNCLVVVPGQLIIYYFKFLIWHWSFLLWKLWHIGTINIIKLLDFWSQFMLLCWTRCEFQFGCLIRFWLNSQKNWPNILFFWKCLTKQKMI